MFIENVNINIVEKFKYLSTFFHSGLTKKKTKLLEESTTLILLPGISPN